MHICLYLNRNAADLQVHIRTFKGTDGEREGNVKHCQATIDTYEAQLAQEDFAC